MRTVEYLIKSSCCQKNILPKIVRHEGGYYLTVAL